jgi:hypothetical protein
MMPTIIRSSFGRPMKKLLIALIALALTGPALGQGGPAGGGPGPVPDPWTVSGNNLLPGGRKVITTAPTTGAAGFNLPHGVAPTVPVNGDTWTTTAGFYVQINGATVGPLSASDSAGFAAISPLGVSFPGGVVTYALSSVVPLNLGGLGGSQAGAVAGQMPFMNSAATAYVPLTGVPLPNAVALGADPTGVADSTAVINANINLNGGLFAPCGTYKVTTISITAPDISFIGPQPNVAGYSCVHIIGYNQFADVIHVSGTVYYLANFLVDKIVESGNATITIASPAVISTGAAASVNTPVIFNTTGALPTGLVPNTTYYIKTILSSTTYTVSATAGGTAINTSGSQSGTHTAFVESLGAGVDVDNGLVGTIDGVSATNQGVGFLLGDTSASYLSNSSSYNNFSHGYQFTNDATISMQWHLFNTQASNNNGRGYEIYSAYNSPVVTSPTLTNAGAYNNGLGNFHFGGVSGSAIADVFATGLTSSESCGPGIQLDNVGVNNNFSSTWLELNGGGCGLNNQTPAGNGIAVLVQSGGTTGSQLQFNGLQITHCAAECFQVAASAVLQTLSINGAQISDAGTGGGSHAALSLLNTTTKYYLTGVTSQNIGSDTYQAYGLIAAVGTNVYLNGGNYEGTSAGCAFSDSSIPNVNGVVSGCSGSGAFFQVQFNELQSVISSALPTPGIGNENVWSDSTDLRLHDLNSNGTIGTTVVANAGATHNFLTSISAAGVVSKAQPAFSDLSGSLACTQAPAYTGDVTASAGGCVNVLATAQPAVHTWTLGQTFSAAPILSTLTGVLLGNGASAVTAQTGTTNYLLKWTGSSGGLSGTSHVYDSGTQVGVGLTPNGCPASEFTICDTGSSNVGFSIGNSSATNGFNFAYAGTDAYAYNIQNGNFFLGVNNATVLQLAAGAVTITGTVNPSGAYYAAGTKGVTCSGALTVIASITIKNGIITAATGTGGTCS